MATIEEIQAEIAEEFSLYDDWMDKYQYIIELGNSVPPLSEEYKVDENLIDGCQSRVWLHADYRDGLIFFQADSDAIITKGLIGLLIRAYSGHTPEEIAGTQPTFINEIGLSEHLSPTRSNGLAAMVVKMRSYATSML